MNICSTCGLSIDPWLKLLFSDEKKSMSYADYELCKKLEDGVWVIGFTGGCYLLCVENGVVASSHAFGSGEVFAEGYHDGDGLRPYAKHCICKN